MSLKILDRLIVVLVCLMSGGPQGIAQWTTGPKSHCPDRLYFKLHTDTMLVRKDLRDIKRKGKAYGAVHSMGWWANPSGLYSGSRPLRPLKRLTTTDTAYRKGSTHLLSGVYRVHWRNGKVKEELIFKQGYILSEKIYYKNGNLLLWRDYDIEFDGCLFSNYSQHCLTDEDKAPVSEYFDTFIDKHPGGYLPSYAWKAKRHEWQLACEIWAEPIRFMKLDVPRIRGGNPKRAIDALLVRSGQPTMPAYVAVQLPRKECQGHRLEPSNVTMTLTHADGSPVERTPAIAVLPSSPDNGLRPRKPMLDGYYYFPLGVRTGDITEAYALSPGSYRMSILYHADSNSTPVLIGSAPLDVYNY